MSPVQRTETAIPPTRICLCGHNNSVHRGRCRVVQGCECDGFVEDRDVPKLSRGGAWLGAGRSINPHVRHKRTPV